MDKRAGRVSGAVVAAGIGLALSTGHGIAAAETTGPDSSESGTRAEARGAAKSTDRVSPTRSRQARDDSDDADSRDAGSDRDAGSERDEDVDSRAAVEDKGRRGIADTGPALSRKSPTSATDDDQSTLERGAPSAAPESDVVVVDTTPPVAQTRAVAPRRATTAPSADTGESAGTVVTKSVPVVARVLDSVGFSRDPRPADSPLMVAVLAWVRRQFDETSSTPTASNPTGSATSTSRTLRQSARSAITVNVRDYGAVGDGVTDDSAAIKAAQAAMTSGATLYFPDGDYRFAQQNPADGAAIVLSGLSNVTIEFEQGARLLMDNLTSSGHGQGHGIKIAGAASHVTLLNPTIEWVTRPTWRSWGDGISIVGYPSDAAPASGWTGSTGKVEFVSIINGRVVNAPQAGAVVMGASDVTVTNFTAIGTLADGLHFNANRRVTVDGLLAQNTGDDGLAFVTYYHPTQPWTYGPTDGPFNQSGIGEWNNGGSTATNITVTGGQANGFRVQGGYDITISDVTISGKAFGFHVNSAIGAFAGDWTSLASRDITISDVTIENVGTGIVLGTNNIDGTEDSKWWDFSGTTISDVVIRNAQNWSVSVETPWTTTSKFAGVTLRNIYAETGVDVDGPNVGGNGGFLLASLRDSVIENVRLVSDHAANILVLGTSRMRDGLAVSDLPSSNLTIDGLVLEGPGQILVQDIAGVEFGEVSSTGADGAGVVMYRVKDATFDAINVTLAGRGSGDGYGVRLLQVRDIDIENIVIAMDDHIGSSWCAVQISGGNPSEGVAGDGVRIDNLVYTTERDAFASDIDVQGGPWGAVNWYIDAHWRHEGAVNPHWTSYTYGDISPL
ncbi:glycosyl hydrolase family 28-related protein [Mycobacterium sp. SMC-4]|uniref:glycosyl hydrolase family 28-related protein n=1 Tax=Mycobacterium sp. SMC-4 TaxID=2857059 RepID=UPI003D000D6A